MKNLDIMKLDSYLLKYSSVFGELAPFEKRKITVSFLSPYPVRIEKECNTIEIITKNTKKKAYINFKAQCEEADAYILDTFIIPKEILDYPKYGCINVHASLLPKLRGGAPIHKAIIDGYKETGITIMYMDVKMDNGDIISQAKTEILDTDNLESLHDRLSIMGRDLLLETLPSIISNTNKRIKQNEEEVTFAYNIKREEEHIDFSKTSREVFNLIRGLSPIPSANAIIFDNEMKIYESKILEKKYNGVCGEIVDITKEGIVVCTGDYVIIITKLKPFGKKMMDASSYVNGIGKDKLLGQVFK